MGFLSQYALCVVFGEAFDELGLDSDQWSFVITEAAFQIKPTKRKKNEKNKK